MRKELQRLPSPASETLHLHHRPAVRRVTISQVEPAAACGRPQADLVPEAEAMRRAGRAEACSTTDPASPDLGPRGPDLASLQAERDVVGRAGPGMGRNSLGVGIFCRGMGIGSGYLVGLLGVRPAVTLGAGAGIRGRSLACVCV